MACWIRNLTLAIAIAALNIGVGSGDEPAKKKPAATRANRLAKETSPYLLLHAHNPVDWYPWGPEALEKAKREKKLIFLSIGYSSCYWCHVMERESFEDAEIAAYLNQHFVCIKIDREERPDLDEIYMESLHLLGRRGGWPLSMFLTPEAKPFYGGTYFPPRDKLYPPPKGAQGEDAVPRKVSGFLTLIGAVQAKWSESPDEVAESGTRVADALRRRLAHAALVPTELPPATHADALVGELAQTYDEQFGGFGFDPSESRRPKFPEPSNLALLIDRVQRVDHAQARRMLLGTLDHMAGGGIRDHIGGGFHRYSTDRFWRVPHFEKMLYDNGQLASVYAEAFALTGQASYRRVVEQLLSYVAREMTDKLGGFYAALDAETDAEEGRYYVWKRDEIDSLLADDEQRLLGDLFGFSQEPNFEGRWIFVAHRQPKEAEFAALDRATAKLLTERYKRPRPLTDTKILTGWNGLMIRGCADAGRLLQEPRYIEMGVKAAKFGLEHARTVDGRLLCTVTAGQAKLNGYLDDYAFFVDGLIALHRATGQRAWLDEADRLMQKQFELFWDQDAGGFFFTSGDHEQLIARSKDPVDSALPSGNAVSAGNLMYLATTLNKPDYLERAERTVRAFAPIMTQAPAAMPRMAVSLGALREAKLKQPAP